MKQEFEQGDKVVHLTAFGTSVDCIFVKYLDYNKVMVHIQGGDGDMVCSEKDVVVDIEFKLNKLGL